MAGPPRVVVDASVAVKWFNPEGSHEQALALRDDHVANDIILVAPVILIWEVGNALRYSRELGASDVGVAVQDLLDLQIVLHEPDPSWFGDAIEWAFREGWSLDDASYVALARRLIAPLYTADEKMLGPTVRDVAKPISEYRGKGRGLRTLP